MGVLVNRQNLPNISRNLGGYEESVRRALFTPEQISQLDGFAREFAEIDRIGLTRVLERQSMESGLVEDLINRSDTAAITKLVETTRGTTARPRIRAAIMEQVFNEVTFDTKRAVRGIGGEIFHATGVDAGKLTAAIDRLRRSGAIGFLERGDLNVLANLREVVQFLPSAADAGISLQAASNVSGLRGLSASAISNIVENVTVGRLFTNQAFQAWLVGGSVRTVRGGRMLELAGAIMAQIKQDIEQEREVLEELQ